MSILESLKIWKSKSLKSIAILIDPDKFQDGSSLERLIDQCNLCRVDFFFVGGSLLVAGSLSETIGHIKNLTDTPIVLFPGSNLHIDMKADAILFLSLISGRNPDLLIGQHVSAAPILRKSELEILSTGYILVGNDANTTVAHISQTTPIPREKSEIAVCTAMAGEMIGMKLIYLDAGSGAREAVPADMINKVSKSIGVPMIVGGGINEINKISTAFDSGADTIVLGTAIEKDLDFIVQATQIKDKWNTIHS